MKKASKVLLSAIVFLLLMSTAALAETPGIVTGTNNLLQDALTWILILIPVGCGCVIAWQAFCKQLNEGDPTQASIHGRAMKKALITSAVGMSAAGIARAFLSYYGS